MPAEVIGIRAARKQPVGHLGPAHPLAPVAARHCRMHSDSRRVLVGMVACGACWERSIRDDERVVVECGLDRDLVADPNLVDDVAVRLALAGEPVKLTRAERREAVRRGPAAPRAVTWPPAVSVVLGSVRGRPRPARAAALVSPLLVDEVA